MRAAALAVAGGLVAGCDTKHFMDPAELVEARPDALVVNILTRLDTGVEEPNPEFLNASDPIPADLVAVKQDYVIGPNDLLLISITGLQAPDAETFKQPRVTETGNINLPLIGAVKAEGLTESQLETAIADAYRDKNLIANALVTVTLQESRNRIFSIRGAVNAPGQYSIVQSDFRLMDAFVFAREFTSAVGIDYVYVIRKKQHDITEVPAQDTGPAPGESPDPALQPLPPGVDPLAPRSEASPVRKPVYLAMQNEPSTEPAAPAEPAPTDPAPAEPTAADAPQTPGTDEGRIITIEDKPLQLEGETATPAPVQPLDPAAAPGMADAPANPAEPFEFNEPKEPTDLRIIRIPLNRLLAGELKYNIVIRPQDQIIVPQPQIGEYYMGGHVARPGVFSLTARNITLKQAVVSAGMLDQVAIPQRTQIIRRLPGNREVFARVDLERIFAGEHPDIYLKPDDQILVGTNIMAPFIAAIRNGFRITYGFGFLYDRNYASDENNNR
jgi:protein involved in polysaccharide export with SLBB domain